MEVFVPIKEFPEYSISSMKRVIRIADKKLLKPTNGKVALYRDGIRYDRSVSKLYRLAFIRICAKPISGTGTPKYFETLDDAVDFLFSENRAVFGGEVISRNTAKLNIKKSILQPSLYPFMYGFLWQEIMVYE